MNSYEQKQQARREFYEAQAGKAQQDSAAAYSDAQAATAGIVMGQPILVGHHSEKRHRAAIERSDRAMRKSCEASDKADYYEQKAASVGRGGVSSDDPEAVAKLRKQLDGARAAQETMKKVNAVIRKHKGDESAQVAGILAAGSFTEEQARELLSPDFSGRLGFPAYAMSNNNANIRRIEKRIEQLEAVRSRDTVAVEGGAYVYREDIEENRVMFEFDGKPAEEVRAILKRNAFKWSPSRGAWVRQLTQAGIRAGQNVRAALDALATL